MRQGLGFGVIAFAAAALMGAAITAVVPAKAQDKMAAVTERQNLMKSNGKYVYGVFPNYVRKGEGTPEDVAKGAAVIQDNLKKAPVFFVAETSATDLPGKTKAKPEIWQDKAKFDAILPVAIERAQALEAAAKTGDKEKISDAFAALNRDGCNACHNQFRVNEPRPGG